MELERQLEGKTLSLNLVQRQICIRMKTLHCQPLLGRSSGIFQAFPEEQKSFLRAGWYEKGVGLYTEKEKVGRAGSEIRGGN